MAGSGAASLLKAVLEELLRRNSSSNDTFSSVGGKGISAGRHGGCTTVCFAVTAATVWVW